MPPRRWPRRAAMETGTRRSFRCLLGILLAVLAVAAALYMGRALRETLEDYAASAARDQVIVYVNGIVKDVMTDERFGADALVELERDGSGGISAVSANAPAVNTLAAEVLSRVVAATEQGVVTVEIPLTNLLGSALLMNHGPSVSVHVTVLSSSRAGFHSEITSAGINQTRHQLFLDLDIQLSCLLPWQQVDTSVQTEVLVSETVIVGQVPSSYLNLER